MMTTMFRLFLAPVALAFVLSVSGQTNAKDEIPLRRLLDEFLAGASRNDAAMHDRFWADDLIYTRSSGARIGKDELMKGVRDAGPRKAGDAVTMYSAADVRIHRYGITAVVAFRLIGTSTRSDGSRDVDEFLNTGVFVKRNDVWKAVAWQATAVPKPKS